MFSLVTFMQLFGRQGVGTASRSCETEVATLLLTRPDWEGLCGHTNGNVGQIANKRPIMGKVGLRSPVPLPLCAPAPLP